MIRDPSDGSTKNPGVRPTMPTLEELKAKYGPNWGLDAGERKAKPPQPAPTIEELQRFYARNPERIARLMGIEDSDQ